MTGYKVSKHQILASTQIIQTCLDNAELREKTMYMDNYYCPHTLGWIEFNEDLEKDHLTYTMTVWGNERDTRRSEVPTVINWLKRLPINLKSQFKSEYPSFKQIEKYLHSKFTFSSCKLSLLEEYQGNRGIFVEVYYKGKLQTRQMIAITNPVTDTRNKGKLPVKFNHRFESMPVKTFFEVLKLTPAQKHLVNDAKSYLNRVVDKFVNANRLRFVGVDKIATVASTKEIVGFDKTAKSFNQVAGTFKKWILPFTDSSEVSQGKLIDLTTLETYSENHVKELLESLIRGWKYWELREKEKIELGGNMVHKSDPGRLMMNVHHLVSDNPHLSEIVWKDVINTFYQISGLLIGFRCTNGVVLTPYDMYSGGVDRWQHRIKIQLIDLLYLDQCKKQLPAKQKLKLAAHQLEEAKTIDDQDAKKELMEEAMEIIAEAKRELKKVTFGAVDSWLQYTKKDLKVKLATIDPNWEKTKANPDILKHLDAMEEALSISEKIESTAI